jgi:hypothetical protein
LRPPHTISMRSSRLNRSRGLRRLYAHVTDITGPQLRRSSDVQGVVVCGRERASVLAMDSDSMTDRAPF